MSGRVLKNEGGYVMLPDRDAKGAYYWIVAPNGTKIAYVNEAYMGRLLLEHLNRCPPTIVPTKALRRARKK